MAEDNRILFELVIEAARALKATDTLRGKLESVEVAISEGNREAQKLAKNFLRGFSSMSRAADKIKAKLNGAFGKGFGQRKSFVGSSRSQKASRRPTSVSWAEARPCFAVNLA